MVKGTITAVLFDLDDTLYRQHEVPRQVKLNIQSEYCALSVPGTSCSLAVLTGG